MNLRIVFGYAQLILGLVIILFILSSSFAFFFVMPKIASEKSGSLVTILAEKTSYDFATPLIYAAITVFLIIIACFEIIFFILSVLLILNGILDIRGD